ncbi:MAG: DUF4345 family protein [Gammaproteobacteria bacterium]|nr:DUF4345 family protein [Gammaproteobacteria bacterium]MBP6053401.1 DUF4345 family protein [Pseudomonadales bacterium]MBK6585194.1 DUF4345 family protein [Gammaproteobacteria bacterium]MBK7169071.1 DUF4345 family protein [Gammaproteobacteria bacterium]MBK7520083.1 DUF4345 family protein [Gammaproteobacteria bacterium]
MAARIFLGLFGAMWLGYGVWCFTDPGYLREAAGIAFISTTGNVDLRATYGGLQMAIGLLLLGGALRAVATRPVLLSYGVLCAGIGSARLAGALLEAEWSTYTLFAVCFEIGSVAAVLLLFARAARR